ncbi:MAG: branched-chain amino acid aminotransferase [Sphingobacteriales bacterium]|nr:MAG: branched-chain amino acid aminotransferase [Sphingobacteriales bacterium]
MIAAADFNITKIESSKLNDINLENIPFGKYFTDYMLEVDYEDGEWKTPEIKPYQPMLMEPSLAAIHYGQSIFEGVKAYKTKEGDVQIFRPYDNYKRFNQSAVRMQMPEVPEDIFMEGMKLLISMDKNWVPSQADHSLYIRPFMFSTDEMIGVRPSEKYKFMIILSPTGPYYSAPMRIYVEEQYVRAVPGGVGYAKAAGNYGAAMYATAEAKKKGYDQVLWTDAYEHKYVQECGTMNVFFIIGNTAITPDLDQGTILAGVTRDSVINVLKDMGFTVEERPLSIEDVIDAHKAGLLYEVFGTGTAATISLIKELRYKDYVMEFDVTKWQAAPEVKSRLNDIRYGKTPDIHSWMVKI